MPVVAMLLLLVSASLQQAAPTKQLSEQRNQGTVVPPNYNPKEDTLYRVYLWFTIFGVPVALGGLVIITRQTYLAKRSVDALVAAERAWVMADIEQDKVHIIVTKGAAGDPESSINIGMGYRNVGKTPCWITEKRIQFALVERLPKKPIFDGSAVVSNFLEPLVRGEPLRFEVGELTCGGEHVVTLSTEGTSLKAVGGNTPVVYGVIKYRDSFSAKRETRFRYIISGHGYLRRIQSAAYNSNT